MQPVLIIADDLTGAADTGIQFLRTAAPAYLISSVKWPVVDFPEPPGVLSVYTHTRHLPAGAAAQRLKAVAKYLQTFQPGKIYKKIDSCLRGNLGAELDALLDACMLEAGFIAPAYPGQQRVTIHDIHRVNGIPVAETEMARDPISPVAESRLSVLLSAQSRHKIGRIDIDLLSGDVRNVISEVRRCLEKGCRHIVFDAATQQHLDIIAGLGATVFDTCLLAGSAGLAISLAGRRPQYTHGRCRMRSAAKGTVLWICGSFSHTLAQQSDRLVQKSGCPRFMLDPRILAAGPETREHAPIVRQAARLLENDDLVLQIAAGGERPTVPPAGAILAGLAELAAGVIRARPPDGLFLSGGDTAHAVLQAIGAAGIRLCSEPVPGLISGTLLGGRMAGRPVVTKAGAFGETDALVQTSERVFRASRSKPPADGLPHSSPGANG